MCEEKKYNDVDCKECKVNVKLRIFRDITKARVSFVERGISEAKSRNRWINEKAEDRRIVMKLKC